MLLSIISGGEGIFLSLAAGCIAMVAYIFGVWHGSDRISQQWRAQIEANEPKNLKQASEELRLTNMIEVNLRTATENLKAVVKQIESRQKKQS